VKDQHLIKGKATVKARLSELKSGSHDLFVAAVDDDDQRDPEPARLSFYMRRSVDIRTQGLHVDFDAEPWNVNSEHARSVRTFVKSLEGPVQDCTDWHYRWGIDSGGKVTVSWKFSADKTANVAHSVDIIKDTFKNKELAACVEKAMKKPRMRYGQDYRPAADVTVTFHMKPFILFFDSASLAGKPGRDVVGAALYQKCTSKAVRKAESTCDRAVQALPGPWDQASKIAAAKAAAGIGEPLLDSGGPDPDAASDATGIPDATATPTPPDIPEDVSVPELDIVPFPEFDPIEVHGQCIEQQIEITLENCMLHLPKKKLWCVDSCLKKAHTCAKKCTGAMDWGEDPYMCKESCWADDAFSCAEHCAIRDTPFEKDEDIVDW